MYATLTDRNGVLRMRRKSNLKVQRTDGFNCKFVFFFFFQNAITQRGQTSILDQMNNYFYFTRTKGLFRICFPKEKSPAGNNKKKNYILRIIKHVRITRDGRIEKIKKQNPSIEPCVRFVKGTRIGFFFPRLLWKFDTVE